MRWVRHVVHTGEMRNAYKIFVGKPKGKTPPRCRWTDNIKMDLGKIGLEGMDWIHLAQDRDRWRAVVYTAMNLPVQ
jgi:hypothetical protein